MDPTPHLRRGDRRPAGGPQAPRPDMKVAVVDFSSCIRLVEHAANAIMDNATTQVVDKQLSWEFFGGLVETDFLAPTIKDLEVKPVDPGQRNRIRDQLLRSAARRMSEGPAGMTAAMNELENLRSVVLTDLQRKLNEVRKASAQDVKTFEDRAEFLEDVKLVCDIVTIWTPAGRTAQIVKSIATLRENYEYAEKGVQVWRKIGGVQGIVAVASDERQAKLVRSVLSDFVFDYARDKAVEKLSSWAGKKVSGLIDRRMQGQMQEVFDGRSLFVDGWENEQVRKYSAKQIQGVLWKVQNTAESLGKYAGSKAEGLTYTTVETAVAGWFQSKGPEKRDATAL